MSDAVAPRVFISYSHDSVEHKARVYALSNRLRTDGINARIDQYEQGTPERGWPIWMHDEIQVAAFVLIVCTETYLRRQLRREFPGVGLGVTWEAGIITQLLYEEQGRGSRFIPVILDRGDASHVAVFLRDATRYELDEEHGFIALRDRLLGYHATPMPPLGVPARTGIDLVVSTAQLGHERRVPARAYRDTFSGNEPVVIRFLDGTLEAFGAERIEVADQVTLHLVAVSDGGKEQLQRLRDVVGPGSLHSAPRIAAAFGMVPTVTAVWLDIRELSHRVEGGMTVWRLVGNSHKMRSDMFDDMTINRYTGTQIAEWRARRILLDDRGLSSPAPDTDQGPRDSSRAMDTSLEIAIAGTTSLYDGRPSLGEVQHSPLPMLYDRWFEHSDDLAGFVAVARLTACMWLILTRTVQFVRALDMEFVDEYRLAIRFEGTRAKLYSNRDADVVAFVGECALRD